MYKILRVIFNTGTGSEEYPVPIGWEISQVIFATDTQAVFVLRQIEQQRYAVAETAVQPILGYNVRY